MFEYKKVFVLVLLISFFFKASFAKAITTTHAVILIESDSSAPNIENVLYSLLDKYRYDYKIVVQNQALEEVCSYQLRIDLSSIKDELGSFFVILDEEDSQISYCFEQLNGECSTEPSNIIWVKLPCIDQESSISLYIKKKESNYSSEAESVFDFYEDFNQPLSAEKWTILSAEKITVENGYVSFASNSAIVSNYEFDAKNMIVEAYSINLDQYAYRNLVGLTSVVDVENCSVGEEYGFYNVAATCNTSAVIYTGNIELNPVACWGDSCTIDYRNGLPYEGDYVDGLYAIRVLPTYDVYFYQNSNKLEKTSKLDPTLANSVHVFLSSGDSPTGPQATENILTDWIRVRKFFDQEITYLIESSSD